MPPESIEARLIRIETQASFQEHEVEKLRDTLLEQGREIHRLTRLVDRLRFMLAAAERDEEEEDEEAR